MSATFTPGEALGSPRYSYPPSAKDWNEMRPEIENLHRSGQKYQEIIETLEREHGFRTMKSWLEPRLKEWGLKRNMSRQRVASYLEINAYNLPPQLRGDEAKIEDYINRRKIPISAAHRHRFKLIKQPFLLKSHIALFAAVSKYIIGAFDNGIWSDENISNQVIDNYIDWTYDNPPSIFGLLQYLSCAGLSQVLERPDWAELMLKAGLKELPGCIQNHSAETLLVLLILLEFFQTHLPTEKVRLLQRCIAHAQYYNTRCLEDVFSKMLDAEQKSLDTKIHQQLLRHVSTVVTSELKDRLGQGSAVCTIIQPFHTAEDRDDHQWVAPASIQTQDPDYFNHSWNIKRYIVLATERHGLQELLQVQETLRRQRDLTNSDDVRETLDTHLQSLERPIRRIGYRDHSSDKDKFGAYWRRMIGGDFERDRDISNPNHIVDMFFGLRKFTVWKNQSEVMMIEKQLDYVFEKIAFRLGVHYKMVQDEEGLYAMDG